MDEALLPADVLHELLKAQGALEAACLEGRPQAVAAYVAALLRHRTR
jgi:hypothetical protein